jgi:hypothetical protein
MPNHQAPNNGYWNFEVAYVGTSLGFGVLPFGIFDLSGIAI